MNPLCVGIAFGTWDLTLNDEIPAVSKLTTSKIVKSSMNLNLCSISTQSALSLDWARYSSNPIVHPCGPDPFNVLTLDNFPCHFTAILLSLKKSTSTGIRDGLTPILMKALTPSL